MSAKSNSSRHISVLLKLREYLSFFKMRVRGVINPPDFGWAFNNIREYDGYLKIYSGIDLSSARILEIGFGARPNRLIALSSMNYDVRGVDLDRPILNGTWDEFKECYNKNGAERALKSFVRHWLFDWSERKALARALMMRGYKLNIDKSRFIVSDIVNCDFEPGSFDLIYSEDVFEHIPSDSLKPVIGMMAKWLSPHGIAIVRPCVYTGITGGHLAEWFPHNVSNRTLDRRSEPWEHLRKRRYHGNVYLNEMTRKEFHALFSSYFEIAVEEVMSPDLGKEWLTTEVRNELKEYSEEELFSNNVVFVLKHLH